MNQCESVNLLLCFLRTPSEGTASWQDCAVLTVLEILKHAILNASARSHTSFKSRRTFLDLKPA